MKRHFASAITYCILIIVCIAAIFPFIWLFFAATHTDAQMNNLADTFVLGNRFLANLTDLNKITPVLRNLFNSVFISTTYTVLVLVIDSMAAYGFAKFKFKGRDLLFVLVLVSMMIPHQVILIPLFIEMIKFGWIDKSIAIILPGAASVFGVFLMRQNLLTFPDSLIEAARIDGASELKTFTAIVVPTMKSAFAALGILSFVNQWGSYLWPLIALNSRTSLTMPLVLALIGQASSETVRYPVVFSGAAVALIPVLITFFIFQKSFVKGILSGAIKG